MFYETMENVLPGMKLVIDSGDGVQKILPLDSFDGAGTGSNTSGDAGSDTAASRSAQ